MEKHKQRLAKVIKQVTDNKQHHLIKIYHGSSNSTRLPDFANRHVVDTSDLKHIVEINVKEQYVLVEPSVQLDELVDATLQLGLMPPVIMEFPGISVGGGVQGGAAESSSFKYGGFHETALEYEIVLGDGSVVTASRQQHADLFWGSACSYGSLGIMTLVKLKLIPALPYVKLTYRRSSNNDEALKLIEKAVHARNPQPDFVDGILFGPHSGTIMTGVFADKTNKTVETNEVSNSDEANNVDNEPVVHFSRPQDEWFYLHAQQVTKEHSEHTELIPIKDYLFRYDRGAFWVGRLGFALAKIPFTRRTRQLLDRRMRTRWLYHWVHQTNLSQRFFVQDIFMPVQNVPGFLDYIQPKLNIWPLWLLPMRTSNDNLDSFGLSFKDAQYTVNVGVWGDIGVTSFEAFKKVNREVEDKLLEFRARKTLYAHSYYPRDTFWQIYDQPGYDKLRHIYHAEGVFENIYDKVTVTNAYKTSASKAMARHLAKKLLRKLRIRTVI